MTIDPLEIPEPIDTNKLDKYNTGMAKLLRLMDVAGSEYAIYHDDTFDSGENFSSVLQDAIRAEYYSTECRFEQAYWIMLMSYLKHEVDMTAFTLAYEASAEQSTCGQEHALLHVYFALTM